jgi:D-alanyl-D-alanine-carboxypeptidase/D-alanyl-D-alanine-endopeptidase
MQIRSLFAFLLIGCAFVVNAQKPKLADDVKASIEKRIELGQNPSIVVGLIKDGNVAYYTFGKTKEGGSKVDEHSIYEIGSISKTFTGILLADQINKGKMKADDPVQLYLPSTALMPRYEGVNITLGQLSDHTSSLTRLPTNFTPANALDPYADYSITLMYEYLSTHTLRRPVGSEYEYSNIAVGLLGHVLGLHTGMSFEELMRVVITNPLGMNATVVKADDNMKKHLAIGHANGVEVPNWDLGAIPGAGGIRSSLRDMIVYIKANMTYDASALSKAMQLSHEGRHTKAGNGTGVGLGWHITPGGTGNLIWHNGGTGGYRTFAGFDKGANIGVVVMTNSDQSVDDIGFHLLDPTSALNPVSPSIALRLREVIDTDGPGGLYQKFKTIKSNGEYLINENDINALGYYYLSLRKIKEARELFYINMIEYPESFNVYDSYAEALMEGGELDSAKYYYQKSLEINPGNQNGVDMLAKMGVIIKQDTVVVDEKTLESYTGTYELAPGFNIVITRDGKQLFGQATGQPQFEMFPKTATEFYLKVTPATAIFSTNAEGKMVMTWMQGGQTFVCKKIE